MVHEIKVHTLKGPSLKMHLRGIARLRLEVFRDFPTLFEGSLEDEVAYLERHVGCDDAIGVVVFDGSSIVGASTGMPLVCEQEKVQHAFQASGYDVNSVYFFSQSVLLKEYRGRGIGHHFFDLREHFARKLGGYHHLSFTTVSRKEHPEDYLSPSDLWIKRGFAKHPTLIAKESWIDIGATEETEKEINFWVKDLHPAEQLAELEEELASPL